MTRELTTQSGRPTYTCTDIGYKINKLYPSKKSVHAFITFLQ